MFGPMPWGGNVGPASRILAQLRAYWEFQQDSGPQYADSFANYDLLTGSANAGSFLATDINQINQGIYSEAGIVGAATDMQSNGATAALLPAAQSIDFFTNSSWSFVTWLDVIRPTGPILTARAIAGVAGRYYWGNVIYRAALMLSASGEIQFWVFKEGASTVILASGLFVDPSITDQWFMACASYDYAAGTIRLRLKRYDNAFNYDVSLSGIPSIDQNQTLANFTFNCPFSNEIPDTGPGGLSRVRFDQACYVNKSLKDDEFDYLFNAGAARSYASLIADAAIGN